MHTPAPDTKPLCPPGLWGATHFPSSSKSWYSSVKRVQVMVAILALGGQARLGAGGPGLGYCCAAPGTRGHSPACLCFRVRT